MIEKNYTDLQLLIEIKNKNANAMSVLYERHWENLYIYAWNILKEKEVVQDIIHDIFSSLWINTHLISNIEIIEGYLKRAVRYSIYKYIRHNKIKNRIHREIYNAEINTIFSMDKIIENKDIKLQIDSIINTLSPQCKEVIKLKKNEFSNKEIAIHLNISPKTVERHITLAYEKLRLLLRRALIIILFLFFE